jgi:hypothetical protein
MNRRSRQSNGRTAVAFCTRRMFVGLAGSLVMPGLVGCYNFRAPFDSTIRTVYVPTFRSQTFRRELNVILTDLLIKEIEKRTPYKVVGRPEGADTVLDGVITYDAKNTVVENPYNYPRQLTAMINVTVCWTRNPRDNEKEEKDNTVTLGENVNFTPEVGETSMTAFYATCQRLATQIVDMMEERWEGGDPTALPTPPERDTQFPGT